MSASLFLVGFLTAAEAGALASVPRGARVDDPVYRIGPEDVLQVAVWNNEAMSRTAPVRPDGRISLPLLNDVPAAGLTPVELREELLRLLGTYMPHPEVSVTVTEVRSFKVTVIGQVPRPDRYELKSAATVVDTSYKLAGATAIFTNNAFERRFRDMHAVTQQMQGRWDHYETVGRAMLGLEYTTDWI